MTSVGSLEDLPFYTQRYGTYLTRYYSQFLDDAVCSAKDGDPGAREGLGRLPTAAGPFFPRRPSAQTSMQHKRCARRAAGLAMTCGSITPQFDMAWHRALLQLAAGFLGHLTSFLSPRPPVSSEEDTFMSAFFRDLLEGRYQEVTPPNLGMAHESSTVTRGKKIMQSQNRPPGRGGGR